MQRTRHIRGATRKEQLLCGDLLDRSRFILAVRGEPPLGQAAQFGPWYRLADLEEYANFLRTLVAAVRASHQAGKSVDEAVAGLSLPERFKGYAMDRVRPFVQAVYDELR